MADQYAITRCEQTRLNVLLREGSIDQNCFGDTLIEPPEVYCGLIDCDPYEGFDELTWRDPEQLETFAHQLLDVAGKLREAREEWRAAGHPLNKQDLDSNEQSRTIWL